MTAKVGAWAITGLLLASAAFAQNSPTGSIRGTVQNPEGGALPGVTVTAINNQTGEERSIATGGQGVYVLPALQVGTYRLSFQLDGFKEVVWPEVTVQAAVSTPIDVDLELGMLEETITVTAEQPLLEKTTAAVVRQLSGEELEAIPSSTRNFTHLLTATGGVSADLPPVAGNDTGSISPSVNGTKTTSNSILFNGIDITSLLSNSGSLDEGLVPAPDILEEVKLQTSLYDASTGRSGGGSFQLVTKSGGNDYNSSVYAYAQDEALSENDYFLERAGLDKPEGNRFETGFALGGPVKKDRLFFFTSFQSTDAETGFVPTASGRALLPAALSMLQGEVTPDSLVAAFRAFNPTFNLTPGQISPLAISLLNARNPVTGGFLIGRPQAGSPIVSNERVVSLSGIGSIGGDPLVELRQVVPAEFEQDQASFRLDFDVNTSNRLQGSWFNADFPSLDPFPDPATLTSPFTQRRANKGTVAGLSDTHVFSNGKLLNEARLGWFDLRNTRTQDDPFLSLTNEQFGISNPALFYDDRDATRRLGHFVNRGIEWSWGGPNDSFNRRDQETVHFSDTIHYLSGSHTLKMGAEYKDHTVGTNLPEEQATEFEKIENFQQFLLGFTSEADTQFGFTEKEFESTDYSAFVTDDWQLTDELVVNVGVRWDYFGYPEEKNGFLGNFDPDRVLDPSNPYAGLVLPSNAQPTGVPQIDAAIAGLPRTGTAHTLLANDGDNFAPRAGFAWTPDEGGKWVIRGGAGIFYDRPSAAFMNTVFSNFPHLREIEITAPTRLVPIQNAFTSYSANGGPNFDTFFPMSLVFRNGNYTIFDGTGLGRVIGNPAETLEFRAVDKNLETPYYTHYNLGFQVELPSRMLFEARYNGSQGRHLLLATTLNQPWDLNDPNVPQFILDRITAAYRAGGGGPTPQDPLALGYGINGNKNIAPNGAVIPTEARAPYLGLNDAEAIYLQSIGYSDYNSLQLRLARRSSKRVTFDLAYTLSHSIDIFSSDPGSTAGGGKPDVPNTGFAVENDSRNLAANKADSDFDRRHRASISLVYRLPGAHWLTRNWSLGVYGQYQSGRPFSVFVPEAGLLRLPFGRLDFAPGFDASNVADGGTAEEWFDADAFTAPAAIGASPRNFLRGPDQQRFDLSLTKAIEIGKRSQLDVEIQVFNVFDEVNLGMPENNFLSSDFGSITNTVGGPRTTQLGLRYRF